jgi:hypothetical protein
MMVDSIPRLEPEIETVCGVRRWSRFNILKWRRERDIEPKYASASDHVIYS